jgi:hypothetical protein
MYGVIEDFITDTERLLGYISRIEVGELACTVAAKRLTLKLGIAGEGLGEAIRKGVDKKISCSLEKIRDGEDIDTYTDLIRELVKEHGLDEWEMEVKIGQAIKEADLKRFTCYLNMIENENIHLISKAREIQRKYGLDDGPLEEAIRRGECAYFFHNVKQIRKGPRFHPLLSGEEQLLRKIARKYGHEEILEDAIGEWKDTACHAE